MPDQNTVQEERLQRTVILFRENAIQNLRRNSEMSVKSQRVELGISGLMRILVVRKKCMYNFF